MNLETLNVSKQQAAEAVINYRRALKLRRNAEDEPILRGYNQILKGRKLIRLSEVIAAGGSDDKHRPRLAVMRADCPLCYVTSASDGTVTFGPERFINGHTKSVIRFTRTLTGWTPDPRNGPWSVNAFSIVPTIPPQHRPVDALSNYHILWEADWKTVPADPALLKRLGGDLWAVLAVWDLTDLERAVLAGRAQS